MATIDGNDFRCTLGNAATRLIEANVRDSRCNCVVLALFYVKAAQDHIGHRSENIVKFMRSADRKRRDPFCSYYFGWFPYGAYDIGLEEEPEFSDREFRSSLATLHRDVGVTIATTGYDLLLCDLHLQSGPRRVIARFSQAYHLSLKELQSQMEDGVCGLVLRLLNSHGEGNPPPGTWRTEAGLLASSDSALDQVKLFMQRHACCDEGLFRKVDGPDYEVEHGDWGRIES